MLGSLIRQDLGVEVVPEFDHTLVTVDCIAEIGLSLKRLRIELVLVVVGLFELEFAGALELFDVHLLHHKLLLESFILLLIDDIKVTNG